MLGGMRCDIRQNLYIQLCHWKLYLWSSVMLLWYSILCYSNFIRVKQSLLKFHSAWNSHSAWHSETKIRLPVRHGTQKPILDFHHDRRRRQFKSTTQKYKCCRHIGNRMPIRRKKISKIPQHSFWIWCIDGSAARWCSSMRFALRNYIWTRNLCWRNIIWWFGIFSDQSCRFLQWRNVISGAPRFKIFEGP